MLTDPIPVAAREVPALSLADAQRLLAALRDDPLYAVDVTALFTGLRAGELAGLAVEYVDLTAGMLRVCQHVQREPKLGLVIKGLKTQASRATFEVVPDVLAVLGDAIGNQSSGLVWTTKSGRPYDPAYLTHHFQAALARVALPVIPLYHVRHYFVSFLPLLDVHPSVARRLARHASMSTTMNIYTSVEDGLRRQAVSKLAAALSASAPMAVDVPVDVREPRMRSVSQSHA